MSDAIQGIKSNTTSSTSEYKGFQLDKDYGKKEAAKALSGALSNPINQNKVAYIDMDSISIFGSGNNNNSSQTTAAGLA